MTEDYKEQLLNYVTGNLNINSGTQKDFNIVESKYFKYNDNEWNQIKTTLQDIGNTYITGILQNDKFDVNIIYGTISPRSDTYNDKGFLIYLDKNFKPIQLILKDKNGNDLKGFHKLYFDEETNRIYGVIGHCYLANPSSTIHNYFTYFNNFLIKINNEYFVDVKYSYDLNDNNFQCQEIIKDPTSSTYLMIGSSPNSKLGIRAIQLKINVGSENEWTRWTPSTTPQKLFVACYGKYVENEPYFKIIYYNYQNGKLELMYNNGNNLQTISYLNILTDNVIRPYTVIRPVEYQYLNENEIYFSIPLQWELTSGGTTYRGELSAIYKYDGDSITLLYKTPVGMAEIIDETIYYNNIYQLNLIKDTDNTLIALKIYSNSTTNTTNISIFNCSRNTLITDNDDNWINIGSYLYLLPIVNALNQTTFLIRKYNIAQICSLNSYIYLNTSNYTGGFEIILTNLSPINSYNGEPYVDTNVLNPLYANLYSNGSLIFSRDLYNISKQNNMTMSSVEIPNSYLNDTTITQNDLISKTNLQMNSNTQNWTKNIYEVVDLNFLNTISVINEDTGEEYVDSAIKINNAITDGGDTNYQNTPCNKYRINYTDNTTIIKPIYWSSIDNLHRQTKITFYVDKAIDSIDFLSNDETTIYLSLPIEVEVGNYYTINQKIRIGE